MSKRRGVLSGYLSHMEFLTSLWRPGWAKSHLVATKCHYGYYFDIAKPPIHHLRSAPGLYGWQNLIDQFYSCPVVWKLYPPAEGLVVFLDIKGTKNNMWTSERNLYLSCKSGRKEQVNFKIKINVVNMCPCTQGVWHKSKHTLVLVGLLGMDTWQKIYLNNYE